MPTAMVEVVLGHAEDFPTTFLGPQRCSSPGHSLLALGWLLRVSQARGGVSPGTGQPLWTESGVVRRIKARPAEAFKCQSSHPSLISQYCSKTTSLGQVLLPQS